MKGGGWLAGSQFLQKARGAFYTTHTAAEYMVRWAVRSPGDLILEPCFGAGAFLGPLSEALGPERVYGAEIDEAAYRRVLDRRLLWTDRAYLGDFLRADPGKPPFPRAFTAVVGNPPYIRLRRLPRQAAARALQIAAAVMGEPMSPSGSLWMPFVLQSCRFLAPGGRIAFVLPYELTYVQYAKPLWRYLKGHFGEMRCVRVHDRLFPDLSQDVVLLLADRFGGATDVVTFETYADLDALLDGRPDTAVDIAVDDVVAGGRPFVEALLPPALRELLSSPRLAGRLSRLGQLSRFGIGYVAGDKRFFHLSAEQARAREIPPAHLRPTLTSGRELRGIGISTRSIPRDRRLYLYDPPADPEHLTAADLRYLAEGEAAGVHLRYKCRIREPWYRVPGLHRPDLLLSVFSERPVMVMNEGGFLASNSLLCGFVAPGIGPEQVVAAWYNSLTLLSCETEVHSLGGGVLILIPGEANKVRVPRLDRVPSAYLAELDRLLRRAGGLDDAFALGDEVILQSELELTRSEVNLIRDGVETLRRWRRNRC